MAVLGVGLVLAGGGFGQGPAGKAAPTGASTPSASPPATAVPNQHCNAITSWAVASTWEVTHVYV